jgi:hypothetical protein
MDIMYIVILAVVAALLFSYLAKKRVEGFYATPTIPTACAPKGVALGFPSPDNRIRLYTEKTCTDSLNGIFVPTTGACLKKGGTSWSYDCRGLNEEEAKTKPVAKPVVKPVAKPVAKPAAKPVVRPIFINTRARPACYNDDDSDCDDSC